jgi:phosphatidylserine/phosphatidylglycerophosphate/cardiolipin synthase-like enzyme
MLALTLGRALAGAALAMVALFAAACSGSKSTEAEKVDAGSDAATQTEASTPDAAVADGAHARDAAVTLTLVTEPDQGMTPIYDLISSAKKSIDLTMYEFVDTTATGLLTTAAKNGVAVRVILDQNMEKSDNTDAYNALSAGGVLVHWANTTYAATHQKTMTLDGTTSAVMTINFTSRYYATGRDFAVVTNDPTDVAAIEKTFEADFTDASITPPNGDDLIWSPTNSRGALVGLLQGAKTSILLENEEMGSQDILSALAFAAKAGVDVKVVMTNEKTWDTSFASLTSNGVKIATYAESASLYIHAKAILVDYGKSTAKAFVGSENFSNASLLENRELGLITSDEGIMDGLNTTLSKDFSGGTTFQ